MERELLRCPAVDIRQEHPGQCQPTNSAESRLPQGVSSVMRRGESKIVTVAAVMVIVALVIVGIIYLRNERIADALSEIRFNQFYRQISGH